MKKLRDIDSAFKMTRLFALVVVVGSLGFAGFVYVQSLDMIEQQRKKVYVVSANGEALEYAISMESTVNKKYDIKNHIKTFHHFFFNLDPDPDQIKRNIGKALDLVDRSGRAYHDIRTENVLYRRMIEGDISSRILTDSVVVDMSSRPYRAVYYGKQKLVRPSKVVFKNLTTSCKLREVSRSDNNPHGLLMENFIIEDNRTYDERIRN